QPHPLEFKDLTAEQLEEKRTFWTIPRHNNQQISAMQVFSDIYRELEQEYIGNTEVRFRDLRDLFKDTRSSIYNDVIHYNEYGNQLIAERMMADISVKNGRIHLSKTLDNRVAKELGGEMSHQDDALVAFAGADKLTLSDQEMPAEVRQSFEILKTKKSCIGCNLSNIDLTGLDLHRVNLSRADLRNAKLGEAWKCDGCVPGEYIAESNLSEANLNGASLVQVNLVQADLRGSYLQGADLRWANLSGASLASSVLDEANFSGAILRDVDFQSSSLNETNFFRANMRETNLSDLKLNGLD
ncbi:uncharacterized protein METZ01_LOCUS378074, partial [marine metagenome]